MFITFTCGRLVKSKCSPQKQSSDFCLDEVRANSVLSKHSSQKYLLSNEKQIKYQQLNFICKHKTTLTTNTICNKSSKNLIIPFFVDKTFGFKNPNFQSIFNTPYVFLIRLYGLSQAAENF